MNAFDPAVSAKCFATDFQAFHVPFHVFHVSDSIIVISVVSDVCSDLYWGSGCCWVGRSREQNQTAMAANEMTFFFLNKIVLTELFLKKKTPKLAMGHST